MVIDMLHRRIEGCQYVVVAGEDDVRPWCCPPLTTEVLDAHHADELAGVMKALADPVRLRLVSIVANAASGEVCACDLPALVGRSQPTVSHHLAQLVAAGVLERSQRGRWAWFHLRPGRLQALSELLDATAATARSPADA